MSSPIFPRFGLFSSFSLIRSFNESEMEVLEGSTPQVLRNRHDSTISASFTIEVAKLLLHSSKWVSAPDSLLASTITCSGTCIFIGVGISPVKISSASCHSAHRIASVRIMLPRPNPSSSSMASAIIATLNACSATDWGRMVGMMVHRSTSAHNKANVNLLVSFTLPLKICDLHSCCFIKSSRSRLTRNLSPLLL